MHAGILRFIINLWRIRNIIRRIAQRGNTLIIVLTFVDKTLPEVVHNEYSLRMDVGGKLLDTRLANEAQRTAALLQHSSGNCRFREKSETKKKPRVSVSTRVYICKKVREEMSIARDQSARRGQAEGKIVSVIEEYGAHPARTKPADEPVSAKNKISR